MALEVNGELIDDETIRAEGEFLRSHAPEAFEALDPFEAGMAIRAAARDRVIASFLLRQKAREEVVAPAVVSRLTEEIQSGANCVSRIRQEARLAESMAAVQLDQLVGKVIAAAPKPRRKEIADYFRSHLKQAEMPEMVRVSHIVKNVDETHSETAARAEIDELALRLSAGADFGELADGHSDCPGEGGDLGWIPRGEMVPEFDEAAFQLPVGGVSPVFRTMFGFHIAKVTGHRPGRPATLDELYGRIENELHRVRQRAVLDQFVGRLREQAVIREVRR